MKRTNFSIIVKKNLTAPDDDYVDASSAERFAMVWDITRDAWSFVKDADVERRLQRDVTTLIRGRR